MSAFDKSDYLAGWIAGTRFVQRYREYPRLVLMYGRYHMKRYRQTVNDAGFIDAINAAYGS